MSAQDEPLVCTDCDRPLPINPRRKGTRCQPCAARIMATSDDKRRKCSEAMKRRLDDPAFRHAQQTRLTDGLRRALAERPDFKARLIETGRRLGTTCKGCIVTPAGSPQRQRAARAQSDHYLAWCPIEYRAGYRRLVRVDGIPAPEARRMTKQLIAADLARFHATGVLPQATRDRT